MNDNRRSINDITDKEKEEFFAFMKKDKELMSAIQMASIERDNNKCLEEIMTICWIVREMEKNNKKK